MYTKFSTIDVLEIFDLKLFNPVAPRSTTCTCRWVHAFVHTPPRGDCIQHVQQELCTENSGYCIPSFTCKYMSEFLTSPINFIQVRGIFTYCILIEVNFAFVKAYDAWTGGGGYGRSGRGARVCNIPNICRHEFKSVMTC